MTVAGAAGIDLVAMSVNDVLVQGAEPLFFLDYFATGHLVAEQACAVVAGVAAGCREANCALLGGETAEMPGMYTAGQYDLAGFAVGVADRADLLPRLADMCVGDLIVGIASSGLHSNGFSLVRRIVHAAGLTYDAPPPFASDATTLGQALLVPTRIYVRLLLPLLRERRIKALAHITGGGIVENLPRVLPPGLCATIDASAWPLPAVFRWLKDAGRIANGTYAEARRADGARAIGPAFADRIARRRFARRPTVADAHLLLPASAELVRTFNCGLGMLVVVSVADVEAIAGALGAAGERAYRVGRLTRGTDPACAPACVVHGMGDAWGTP